MTAENILIEARDTIMCCLGIIGENSVFPEGCETNEYSATVEDGAILIPTKFKANGERIFVEIHLNLTSL